MSKSIALNQEKGEVRSGPPRAWPSPGFHELAVEDQIKKASVIAVVRYHPAPDGKVKAVLSQILKKEPGVRFRYDIGDEYPPASHYTREGTDRGEGQILFFVGSPAEMQMSTSFSEGRIDGLGDIPLQLFREKCSGKTSAGDG